MIVTNRRLHAAGTWMVVNLSVSDALLLVLLLLTCNRCTDEYVNHWLLAWCYDASMLSTFGITVDQYISVNYSLRYNSIVTNQKVVGFTALIWIISALFTVSVAMVHLETNDWIYFNIPHYIIRFAFCVLFLTCSLYIKNVRDKHERAIMKQNRYFGVQAEKLNMLRRLRASVVDIIRLNITTALIVFLGTLLIWIAKYPLNHKEYKKNWSAYRDSVAYRCVSVVYCFYLISNPILYILVTIKLRREYLKLFRKLFTLNPKFVVVRNISSSSSRTT